MRDRIAEKIRDYEPNDEVVSQLESVHFVALIGPSASGKNAIAHGLENLGCGFKKVISFTTRQPRPEEVEGVDYYFRKTDESFFSEFENQLDEGKLVQAAVHSTTGDYYYSTIKSYNPGGKSMLDVLPSAVEDMRKIPFGNRTEIMIATPFYQWLKRFEVKSAEWDEKTAGERKKEAVENLRWGLNRPDISWVLNEDGKLEHAANDVVAAVNGKYSSAKSKKARRTGREMLDRLKDS